jgi:hypothetical protein
VQSQQPALKGSFGKNKVLIKAKSMTTEDHRGKKRELHGGKSKKRIGKTPE